MKSTIYNLSLLVLVLTITQNSVCQINTSTGMSSRMQSLLRTTSLYTTNPYENVVGNPYIDEQFQEGEILFKDSSVYEVTGLRLNHNNDQIEFKQDEQILAIPNPKDLISVSFGDHLFYYERYVKGKKILYSYFEVLVPGKISLYYRRASIIKREKLAPSEMSGGNYRDYIRTVEDYYIKKEGEPAFLINKTQKSILKALSDKEAELEEYIDQNKLKIKKEEHLKDLIEYYNSLL